jgi:hypothetical protein
MKASRLTHLLAAAGFLAGLAAGGLLGGTARAATVDGIVWMNPGATSTLNCGWHGECTPTSGVALDWANGAEEPVYFRGFGA